MIEALDDKSANRLSPADLHRILGGDPSRRPTSSFGMIFLGRQQDDLAVKALERGLVYDEDNPQIALLLAETLLRPDKADQALGLSSASSSASRRASRATSCWPRC